MTTRNITITDPNHHTVTGGYCVVRYLFDGAASIEGECSDEADGVPCAEIEECLVSEGDRPVGHVVRCETTLGVWEVTLGGVAA